MGEAGVALSATWNETLPLWLYHRDNGAGYECTHYCAPSAPQVCLVIGVDFIHCGCDPTHRESALGNESSCVWLMGRSASQPIADLTENELCGDMFLTGVALRAGPDPTTPCAAAE